MSFDKKLKLVILLCFAALFIFILDFFISSFIASKGSEKNNSLKDEIVTIDAGIDDILISYGIKKEWKTKQNVPLKDELQRFERVIKVPYNFPVVDMNREITKLCSNYSAKTTSNEDIKNQIIQLHIYHRGLVIQNIKIITDPSLQRVEGNLNLIMNGLETLSDIPKSFVLKSTLFKTFLLGYRKDNSTLIRLMKKLSKEYLIELNVKEQLDDEEFDVYLGMDSIQIRKKIKNIIRNMENSAGFYVSYDKYDENFNQILKKEVEKQKKYFILKSRVIELKESGQDFSDFSEVSKIVIQDGSAVCIVKVSDGNINNIIDAMRNIQRKGFRFSTIKEIIKN